MKSKRFRKLFIVTVVVSVMSSILVVPAAVAYGYDVWGIRNGDENRNWSDSMSNYLYETIHINVDPQPLLDVGISLYVCTSTCRWLTGEDFFGEGFSEDLYYDVYPSKFTYTELTDGYFAIKVYFPSGWGQYWIEVDTY